MYGHDAEAVKVGLIGGGAAAVSPRTQRTGPGETARLAGDPVRREEDGAELRPGHGNDLPAAALESLTLSFASRGPLDTNLVERALKKGILHRKNTSVL